MFEEVSPGYLRHRPATSGSARHAGLGMWRNFMGRRQVLAFVAGAAAMWGAGLVAVPGQADARVASTAVGTVQAAGSWGKAVEVRGLGALNKGGKAAVSSVTCGS